MSSTHYEDQVFVNCPFDDDYRPLFESIVFAVHDCGFIARCALEVADSSQTRINKIFDIVEECKHGVHDISRTELDAQNHLPRFNMPLELGIFLAAKRFGVGEQKAKQCLVLDRDRFRYQKFCSDISGQDIEAHGGKIAQAIRKVRDWLRTARPEARLPGGSKIAERYESFRSELPQTCRTLHIREEELTFLDFQSLVVEWLSINVR